MTARRFAIAGALCAAAMVPAGARADEAKVPAKAAPTAPKAPAAGPSAGAPAVVAPVPKQPTPPPPPVEMKPAPEIAAAAKAMVGSYKCKGNVMNPDGSSSPSVGSMKVTSELDGFYILVAFDATTKASPHPIKGLMYRTYDAGAKKWVNTMLGNGPMAPITQTTTDAMGGPVTWTDTFEMSGAKIMERSHEEPDAKTHSVHMWSEMSMDGGKAWVKEYEITCKK